MSAGCVVLGELFTSDTAITLTARGEELRGRIDDVLHQHKLPLNITGFGSMNAIHALERRPQNGSDLLDRDPFLQEALFLALLRRGVYTAPRGSLNLGLAVDRMGPRPLPQRARRIARRAQRRAVEQVDCEPSFVDAAPFESCRRAPRRTLDHSADQIGPRVAHRTNMRGIVGRVGGDVDGAADAQHGHQPVEEVVAERDDGFAGAASATGRGRTSSQRPMIALGFVR